jgi:hypothetical protein
MRMDLHVRVAAQGRSRLGARVALLASLLAIAPVACGGGDDDGAGAETGAGAKAGKGGEAPVLELEDAGAGPRQALELQLAPGDEAVAHAEMDMSIAASLNGNAAPAQELPTMGFDMAATVEDVSADEITVSVVYRRFEVAPGRVDPALAARIERNLATLEGLRGRMTLTPNGTAIEGDLDPPAGLNPSFTSLLDQFEQQLTSLAQPFPEEPVGVGARWSVTADLELGGISTQQRTNYTLEKLARSNYVLSTEVEQTMRPGPIDAPSLREADAELVSGETRGSGRTAGSLSSPLPRRSKASTTSDQVIDVTAGGESGRLEQKIDVGFALQAAG